MMSNSNLLTYLSDIIICLDAKNKISKLNQAAVEYFGIKREEILDKDYFDFCQEKKFSDLLKIYKNDRVNLGQNISTKITNALGKLKIVQWNILREIEFQGTVNSVVFVGKDITKETLAEKNVRNTEERVKSIINTIAGNFWWKDLNGIYQGANDAVIKILHLDSVDEVVGKTDYELPWSDAAETLVGNDQEVMALGNSVRFEEVITTNKGEQKYMIVVKAPLRDESGNIVGTVGTSTDITEIKQMESELKSAKEKAEAASQIMEMISASIAHELRTPLRAISANAMGIKKYLPTLIDAYHQAKEAGFPIKNIRGDHFSLLSKALGNITDETQSLFTVVDMLLVNVNKLDIKSPDFELCSMATCIEKALTRYPFNLKQQQKLHWEGGDDFFFYGKEILIVHVLFNLIKNALYYIAAANKGEIYIFLEHKDDVNILHFKDTGKGIRAQVLPYIFDRFFTKTRHGAGIGLAYCKMVMQAFNGDITCHSREGEYAEFLLTFPKVKREHLLGEGE